MWLELFIIYFIGIQPMHHDFWVKLLKTAGCIKRQPLHVLPRRMRVIAWVSILLQLRLPSVLSFKPAITKCTDIINGILR
ncbi:hypothetical protein DJ56_4150 [Yersinia pestis]|nr:hypothetical protein DJ56_4150 [Yersinia pestis]KGA68126.1 hypothetical protein DJ55_4183 [Yersinia pseudotuberculosis]